MNNNELLNRIRELEKENSYLKGLLERAGIRYESFSGGLIDSSCGFDADVSVKVTREHAIKFFSYFWGRTDVFSKRYRNKNSGKTGYYTQCDNFWRNGVCPKIGGNKVKCKDCPNRSWTKLDVSHIEAHLNGSKEDGSDVVGVYPLFPDGTCRFLVFDFDNHDKGAEEREYANGDDSWMDEIDALRRIFELNSIPFIVERSRSGKGAHFWLFFDSPISASLARRFGFALLNKGADSVNLKNFKYYDRMLPAQDVLINGELGNLIALPLQGWALKHKNSAFVDGNWNAYPDQWGALFATKKVSKVFIESLLSKWDIDGSNGVATFEIKDDTKPWEKSSSFNRLDVTGEMDIVLADRIYVWSKNLSPRIQNQIRRLAAFSNPKFYKNNAIGFSNYDQSRYIYLGEDDGEYICIPRGLLDTLIEKCNDSGIDYRIGDKRSIGRSVTASFVGQLRSNQEKAIEELLKYDCGILSAATAFGKTVTCSGIIAKKKVSTLILLESSTLVEQWERALNTFLRIEEELPEYQTPSGKIKRRNSPFGIIQGSKDTSTGIVDIAMAGSLFKKGEPHPRLKEYGMVLVDECHHAASDTVSAVLKIVKAKYVYGVTATPFRGDGLDKINFMLLGPVRYRYTAKDKASEQNVSYYIVPRFTRTVCPYRKEKFTINDAYEIVRNNKERDLQIIEDIRKCISDGRTPVVLTRYTDHAARLYEGLKDVADRVFLLTGALSKKEQRSLRENMNGVDDNESLILVATGQLIGEGFDYPRLDTLIMATPVAWKGIVEQYAGRLNRDYNGKENVMIYDYIDSHIPVFDKMYAKRMKAYKRIGYKLYTDELSPKQVSNAIFDCDSYLSVYEKDLLEANDNVVISSPSLSSNKVRRFISLLKEKQEKDLKVTVVTWDSDFYKYGWEEHRLELIEMMRRAGFYIKFVKDHCEHYAVIDNEIVWYGSMNLLSKDDADDNIMRVVDGGVAAELLENSFGAMD